MTPAPDYYPALSSKVIPLPHTFRASIKVLFIRVILKLLPFSKTIVVLSSQVILPTYTFTQVIPSISLKL